LVAAQLTESSAVVAPQTIGWREIVFGVVVVALAAIAYRLA